MADSPPAGSSIALIRVSDRSALPPGRLTANGTIAVDRAKDSRLGGGELLAVGELDGRKVVANAVFARSSAGADIYRIAGEWRLAERRMHRRTTVALRAEVHSVLGGSRQHGTVVDLSSDGAAVEVAQRPGGRRVDLLVDGAEFSASLPAHVIDVEKREDSVLLHVEFGQLSHAQQVFVRQLLARIRPER
jgi:hypothetical protein